MFLDSITLTQTTPCLAEPDKIIVTGKPSRALDEVLPYLATLPNVIGYNPGTNTLTLRRQPGFVTLYSQRVSITQVKDVQEGLELLEALKEAINATWKHRFQLTPATERQRQPRPLEIYAILPQTNCKQCSEATCMAFACMLLTGKRVLTDCKPLYSEAGYQDRRNALEAML